MTVELKYLRHLTFFIIDIYLIFIVLLNETAFVAILILPTVTNFNNLL